MNTKQNSSLAEVELLQLVDQFGENNWEQIASVLADKNIIVKPKSIEKLWYKLNPNKALEGFTEENLNKMLETGLQEMCSSPKNYNFYCSQVEDYNGTAIKLNAAFQICLRKALCCITRILGRKKHEQIDYFRQLDLVILKYLFKFSFCQLVPSHILKLNYDCKNAYLFQSLLFAYTKYGQMPRAIQYEQYIKICTKDSFDQTYQFIKQLTILRDIAKHKLFDEQLQTHNFQFKTVGECKISIMYAIFIRPIIWYAFNRPYVTIPLDFEIILQLFTDVSTKQYFIEHGKNIIKEIKELDQSDDPELHDDLITFMDPQNKFEQIIEQNPFIKQYVELIKQAQAIRMEFLEKITIKK